MSDAAPPHPVTTPSAAKPARDRVTVELSAAIVAASPTGPSVLVVRDGRGAVPGLPSGPLEATHRTLEAGLRAWVAEQTRQQLGHVEQQGLVEETGQVTAETGGRPARLLRFRPEGLLERPAPGLRLPRSRSIG